MMARFGIPSFNSLALRVITLSTVLAVIALIAIGAVISALYRESSEQAFRDLLAAQLFNLIGSAGAAKDGTLEGSPDLGDYRYSVPNSGWYWSVEPVSGDVKGELHSLSLIKKLPGPNAAEVPFDAQFRRTYTMDGLDGERLQVVESEVYLEEAGGAARFRVMGNRTELESKINAFERQIYFYLILFGVGMIAINALAIRFAMRPLGRVRSALAAITEGQADGLQGRFPDEIEPLVNEMNKLIENNRSIVERARTQVGNLAHSLKTPLAVLKNESASIGGGRGKLVADQARSMQTQIDHYLQRARIAAQRNTITHRTDAAATLQRMVRVIAKLNPDISVMFLPPDGQFWFAGEKEDFEEIMGNLLENAAKWAKAKVKIQLEHAGQREGRSVMRVTIGDDGPGIPKEKVAEVLKRGKRLDETTPGSGLGLSIVKELVFEYGGKLELAQSNLGGLQAVVELNCAKKE
jgi:signal transduction histidine kinase